MKKDYLERLTSIQAMAIDLDGVVYRGDLAIPGAAGVIRHLRKLRKKIYFITNNSGKSRKSIQHKLRALSIPAKRDEIITSAYATGKLLKSLEKTVGESFLKVRVIGSDELKSELREFGIAVEEDNNGSRPDFLVVGFDQEFSYKKICLALDVLSAGAKFVACNRDRTFPVENGIRPGCGSMVASIEWAIGRKPDYVVGKPNTYFLEMIVSENEIKADQILVVGDMAESDIAMAVAYGSPSVLVSKSEGQANSEWVPNLKIGSLADLPEACNFLTGKS